MGSVLVEAGLISQREVALGRPEEVASEMVEVAVGRSTAAEMPPPGKAESAEKRQVEETSNQNLESQEMELIPTSSLSLSLQSILPSLLCYNSKAQDDGFQAICHPEQPVRATGAVEEDDDITRRKRMRVPHSVGLGSRETGLGSMDVHP